MIDNYTHLHSHSIGSVLDGLSSPEEIVLRVKELGQESVALTDHGNMAASLQFYKAAKKHDIKPLIGVEAYVADDRHIKEKSAPIYHMGLLAMNQKGLENLYALSDIAWNEGFYKKPRIDFASLLDHGEGLIVLSGCMDGAVSQHFLNGELETAEKNFKWLSERFEDRFLAEIQPWNPPKLNEYLIGLADEAGVRLVATADTHFCTQDEKLAEEVNLLIAQTSQLSQGKKDVLYGKFAESRGVRDIMERVNFLHPDRKLRFDKIDNYLMSSKNLRRRMEDLGIDREDIYVNTVHVANECNVEMKTKVNYFPKYSRSLDANDYLRELAFESLQDLGLGENTEYVERLETELDVIQRLDFADYMLVVWDMCHKARSLGIRIGPGRGSVGGSLLAYVLRITKIDPIKFGLLFWRFLNIDESGKSARNEPPDIDTDVEDRRRDEVKNYMIDRWKYAANISTVSKFSSKGMVRDISRCFAIPLAEVNDVCKHFENLDEFLESESTKKFRDKYPEVPLLAKKLGGRWKAYGLHAAGVVIANKPLQKILPLESRAQRVGGERIRATSFDMDDCAEIGLIKMDVLGLSTLSVISDALEAIEQRTGETFDIDTLEPDDPEVFREFSLGHTVGIFQTEAQFYTSLLKDMQIDSFDDLVVSNALVRPGPLLTGKDMYINRKAGNEPIPFEHEKLSAITDPTQGLFVYQEQLIQALVDIGGFTWSEADKIRKIIGKKRNPEEFKPYEDKWIDNASKFITKGRARKLWADFLKFAGYALNKSHATAYSYISYQTMWLKTHYPIEFVYALLKNEGSSSKVTTVMMEAKRMGVELLPPNVNHSNASFKIEGEKQIRFGLENIKGIGANATQAILSNAPFTSVEDFRERTSRRSVNERIYSTLYEIGALDGLEGVEIVDHAGKQYEYLGLPQDLEIQDIDVPAFPITNITDYPEDKVTLIRGLVKDIEYKETYSKINVEDQTDLMLFFQTPDFVIEEGRVILALGYNKDLIGFTYLEDFKHKIEMNYELNRFERLLMGEVFGDETKLYDYNVGTLKNPVALVMPLHIRKFKVKNGKMRGESMARAFITDGKEYKPLVLFPRQYKDVQQSLSAYIPLVIKTALTKDGGLTVADGGIKLAREYMRQKGL